MKTVSNYIKIASLVLLAVITLLSCANDDHLNDLNETIFVRHKNADMPAYIVGNGSEKVFLITLNGGPGGVGLEFVGTAFTEIEENYGVVYFDQRGSGMSQGTYDEEDLTIDVKAEDVLALTNVIKAKYGEDSRFFLLGHSWGGTLGTATLLKDQSDFKGWIEVDGANNPAGMYDLYIDTFTTTANTQIDLGNNVAYWESVLEQVSQVDPASNLEDFLDLNSLAFDLESVLEDDDFIDKPVAGSESDGLVFEYNILTTLWNSAQIASILVDDQNLFQTLDFTDQLPQITIPSLFISGRYDMVVPLASAEAAFQNIGATAKELLIFERSGHAPPYSEPERFAQEVLRFMDTYK